MAATIRERFHQLLTVVGDDVTAQRLIQDVKACILRYHDTVISMDRTLHAQRYRVEGEELRDLTQRLDTLRHTSHERLVDSVVIANRYLFKTYGKKVPTGGIYTESPHHLVGSPDRCAIGSWAMQNAVVLQ